MKILSWDVNTPNLSISVLVGLDEVKSLIRKVKEIIIRSNTFFANPNTNRFCGISLIRSSHQHLVSLFSAVGCFLTWRKWVEWTWSDWKWFCEEDLCSDHSGTGSSKFLPFDYRSKWILERILLWPSHLSSCNRLVSNTHANGFAIALLQFKIPRNIPPTWWTSRPSIERCRS